MKKTDTKLRAVGYCRTSGEGQRDNSSIPKQRQGIEEFVKHKGWQFIRHYIDECKSGSYIEGRHNFQLMLKDAPKKEFDIIVPYDIDRFARDGVDIISNADLLKKTFDISIIAVRGSFNNFDNENVMTNYVFAGMAEQEKLNILHRTIRGRIENAKDGLQWSPKPPFGREFTKTGKRSGEWRITEDGRKIKAILEAYVNDDKSFRELARQHGISSAQRITRLVREAQLAANPYKVVFNSPKIGIVNREVLIPAVPTVISQRLEKRVLAKMGYNKKNKRQTKRNYLLSGMVRCACCGKFLKGQSQRGRSYYTHNNFYADRKPCPYNSIRLELLETHVMDYLTEFFFNKPVFDKAIKAALPTNDDRDAIVQDIDTNKRALNKANTKISNLVKAIASGADVSLLLNTQNQLKAEKEALEKRGVELEETLQTMPEPKVIKAEAGLIRGKMIVECLTKDWRDVSYEDLRRFLHFLFSDNPKQNNYGILLGKQNDKWRIDFEGCFDFNHIINEGKAELKADLSDDEKVKIAEKMKAKDSVIEAYGKYEGVHNKVERLQDLINQAENAEKVPKDKRLFIDKDYL